jgi:cytoskeletal protein CcmA (bactofilin family)
MFHKPEKTKESYSVPETDPVVRGERPAQSAQKAAPSIISGDLKITGDLQSQGDVHIDGTIEGDIKARSVTIGDNARINGRVSGDKVRICGNLVGGVDAEMVELTKTARVEGDILHGSLQIEAGAFLEGQLRRREGGQSAGRSNGNGKVTPFGNGRDEASSPTTTGAQSAAS